MSLVSFNEPTHAKARQRPNSFLKWHHSVRLIFTSLIKCQIGLLSSLSGLFRPRKSAGGILNWLIIQLLFASLTPLLLMQKLLLMVKHLDCLARLNSTLHQAETGRVFCATYCLKHITFSGRGVCWTRWMIC